MIWLFSLLQIITNIIKKNWEAITETLSKKVKNHTVKQDKLKTTGLWRNGKLGNAHCFVQVSPGLPKGMLSQHLPWGTELLHCFFCGSSEPQLAGFPVQGFKVSKSPSRREPLQRVTLRPKEWVSCWHGTICKVQIRLWITSTAEMPQENPVGDVLIKQRRK